MRFPISILAISALIAISALRMKACGPYYIEDPKQIRLFRSCPPELERQWQEGCRFNEYEKEENCLLWQRITAPSIPLENIKEVVYDARLSDIESLRDGYNADGMFPDNAFANWLSKPEHREDLEYIATAKEIEEIRSYMSDPWYYPYEGDDEHIALARLRNKCLAYGGKRHASRYALQLARLYLAEGDYQACIRMWEDAVCSMPRDIVTDMIASYAGGAYFRKGDRNRAIDLYTRSQDIGSLINLKAWNNSEEKSQYKDARIRELEYIFNRFPDSPLLGVKLQESIRRLEYVKLYPDDYIATENDKTLCDELKRFALSTVSTAKCVSKGMWLYALGYLHYLDGEYDKALSYLNRAERADASTFIKESIHAFRFLMDARLADGSSACRRKLLKELRWLDRLMERDIKLKPSDNWQYDDKLNRPVLYWQDVAHKVLLGEIAPRLRATGNSTLSLQLANYATNRIHQLSPLYNAYHYGEDDPDDDETYVRTVTFDEYRKEWKDNNWFDYSNQFFESICGATADEAAAYARSLEKPSTELEKFLNARSYFDRDYIYDIVGTLYMREMNYTKAEEWLSRVSACYQARTNIAKDGYFKLDPFKYQTDKKHFISDSADYRLKFAQEMSRLEKLISSDSEVNRKAEAKLRYAIGLRNSFGRCWYLTSYGYDARYVNDKSGSYYSYNSGDREGFENNPYAQQAYKKADDLTKQAIAEFTDREQAARSLLEMKNLATVMKQYPGSRAAAYIRTRCDNYHDYNLQKK